MDATKILTVDQATQVATAFNSFEDLLAANYTPTLQTSRRHANRPICAERLGLLVANKMVADALEDAGRTVFHTTMY